MECLLLQAEPSQTHKSQLEVGLLTLLLHPCQVAGTRAKSELHQLYLQNIGKILQRPSSRTIPAVDREDH